MAVRTYIFGDYPSPFAPASEKAAPLLGSAAGPKEGGEQRKELSSLDPGSGPGEIKNKRNGAGAPLRLLFKKEKSKKKKKRFQSFLPGRVPDKNTLTQPPGAALTSDRRHWWGGNLLHSR